MNLKQAKEITGHHSGLGKPSKMPGFSTALSAARCVLGSILAGIEGTGCSNCYAARGNYLYPDVKLGHERRYQALTNPLWTDGMVKLIGHYTDPNDPYFRIHDSGDFQSVDHVLMWVEVAERLPWVEFWAPSREGKMIREAFVRVAAWPVNLVIRLSATMIGGKPPRTDLPTSTIDAGMGHGCPALKQDGKCGSCRACWNPKVSNIDYHKH